MTDLDIIKECRQTGKPSTTKKLLEKAYYEQMTKNNSAPDIIEIGGVKYQKVVEEPKEPQTLYDALQLRYFTVGYHFNEGQKDWICKVVEEWLSQFYLNKMSFENLSYRNAFFDALDLVRKTLR